MKTVGQFLKAGREQRGLSIDHLSHLTKIDPRYILALEADKYSELPSETFTKGFIRNISQRLGLDPDDLVAIFRRDFRLPNTSTSKSRNRHPTFALSRSAQLLPFIIGGLVFVVYLVLQFRSVLTPPKLEISRPTATSVLVSPVEIEGYTDVDTTIYINEDTQIKPDLNGHFLARINLPVGETNISVKATNRFSRTTDRNLLVTIISK